MSELLMGRKLKTKVPLLPSTLLPKLPNHALIKEKETKTKQQQRENFNKCHAAREASPLRNGDNVFIKDMKTSGEVVTRHQPPLLHCPDRTRVNSSQQVPPGGHPYRGLTNSPSSHHGHHTCHSPTTTATRFAHHHLTVPYKKNRINYNPGGKPEQPMSHQIG